MSAGEPAAPTLAAIVLAAGGSTRMGRPKALVPWRGRSFLAHVVALARATGADPIVVVEGAHALPDAELAGATKVVNAAWAEGPLGSLQTGLRAVLPVAPQGVLVLGVDRPHVATDTVLALVHAFRADPSRAIQPAHAGRHGHPIVWPADLAHRLLDLRPPASPRDVLHAPEVASRRRFVQVDDAAVLDNIDRTEDLARLP